MTSSTTPRTYFQFKSPHAVDCAAPTFSEDWAPLLLILFYCSIGTLYAFTGYRYLKTSMYLTGFNLCLALTFFLITNNQPNNIPPYGKVCISLSSGFLFGLISTLIQIVGLFLNGFHGGVAIVYGALAIYDHTLEEKIAMTMWPSLMLMMAGGICMGTLCLFFKRGGTIIATSVYGGALVAATADFMIERMVMVRWTWDRAMLEPPVTPPCPLSWLALAIWPIVTILGIIVQSMLTGTGIRHEPSIASQRRRQKARPCLTREQRADLRQKKYRYLYQVRTAHGDVISQPYIQALQRTICNKMNLAPGECSTLQSDSTHLTVLAPDPGPHLDSDEEIHQIRVCH